MRRRMEGMGRVFGLDGLLGDGFRGISRGVSGEGRLRHSALISGV